MIALLGLALAGKINRMFEKRQQVAVPVKADEQKFVEEMTKERDPK